MSKYIPYCTFNYDKSIYTFYHWAMILSIKYIQYCTLNYDIMTILYYIGVNIVH